MSAPPPRVLSERKPIAVSMGDPAGIGPEIIVKAWQQCVGQVKAGAAVQPLWVAGHRSFFLNAIKMCAPGMEIEVLATAADAAQFWRDNPKNDRLVIVEAVPQPCAAGVPDPTGIDIGVVSQAAGMWAARAIEVAAHACMAGLAGGLLTAPIHKVALERAGYDYPGHTEFLQALAARAKGVSPADVPVRMLLANPSLQTVLLSIHVSLRAALDLVTVENLFQTLQMTHDHVPPLHAALRGESRKHPKIAVAGVNPHAGESGRFGDEEQRVMVPAVAAAQAAGIDVTGPISPDTVYMRARQGEFDVVIAAYHDQGLIPVKYLGVDEGVNVTLGLPFLRASPDHGTAFEIAAKGVASPDSLLAALKWLQRWSI